MKSLAIVLVAIFLSACATGPTYQAAETSEFTQANYSAVDKLIGMVAVPIANNAPLLVATVVNVNDMSRAAPLGRTLSEQYASVMSAKGFNVKEIKLRGDVFVREGQGELLLSREVKDIARNHNASLVLVTHDRQLAARCDRTLTLVKGVLQALPAHQVPELSAPIAAAAVLQGIPIAP